MNRTPAGYRREFFILPTSISETNKRGILQASKSKESTDATNSGENSSGFVILAIRGDHDGSCDWKQARVEDAHEFSRQTPARGYRLVDVGERVVAGDGESARVYLLRAGGNAHDGAYFAALARRRERTGQRGARLQKLQFQQRREGFI